mmetsp:Transcript_1618/g.3350  ORF Transcript_1618/g.3350 Transcript_1618/m.3350 type:complete len:184 (-) Transcript_1618:163-714(-)
MGPRRGCSRSPRWGSERISRAVVALGRYPDKRPQGLRVNSSNAFLLRNLMEVWGERQGLREEDVLDALREHMFHQDSASLRFAINDDGSGNITIRVHPKRGRSRSRSPCEPPRSSAFAGGGSRAERRARRLGVPPPARAAPREAPSPEAAPPAPYAPARAVPLADKLDMCLDDLITRDVDPRR